MLQPFTQADPTEIFSIRARLGQGSFGTVWQAEERQSGRLVAIKVLSLDGSRHEPYAMLALRYEQSAQYDKALDYRAKAATLVPPNLRPQAAEAGAQPPADFRCLMLYS